MRRRQIEQWVESMAADYRQADERAPSAPRATAASMTRRCGASATTRSGSARELAWQLAYAEALFGEVWPGPSARRCVSSAPAPPHSAPRVAPSIVAAGAAALTLCACDRCAPCSIDRAACAWAFDALRDPLRRRSPGAIAASSGDFGHAQADFERRAQYVEETRRRQARSPGTAPGTARLGATGPGPPWVDPPPAGAFVLAVTEALQRSLAAAR